MSQLLKIKAIPLTRLNLRKMTRETELIIRILDPIEIEFCKALFEDNNATYRDIYTQYLREFNKALLTITVIHKPKFCEVNPFYFAENFKPIV